MSATRKRQQSTFYHFTLFMAGKEMNSRLALQNIQEICEGALHDNCRIRIVDVYEDFEHALQERIVVTPALIVSTQNPDSRAVFFGTLQDKSALLSYLNVENGAHEPE
ncbi:MAG: hypothetical protein GF398_18885 [Chitinivibrionales bacterium]|nr:hypothetical protein [Chitinivibrionales bacterium]